MKTKTLFTTVLATLALLMQLQAQASSSTNYDARLLTHYSTAELDYLKAEFPEDYQTFSYYLTQSYSLEITSCFECTPINPTLFDISKYEYLRKKDETVIYDDPKHGFKLTVFSLSSLLYLTPEQVYKSGL
jgi:hypothetical protein